MRTYRFLKAHHHDIRDATEILKSYLDFNPVIVGTFPIDIAIETSDIHIVMQSQNLELLKDKLYNDFSSFESFELSIKSVLLCRFKHKAFEIEIYATENPVTSLNSYRHLVIEERLLNLYPDSFKQAVIDLKKSGIKTEPAFARLLGLEGDPYQALLALEALSDEQLLGITDWRVNGI